MMVFTANASQSVGLCKDNAVVLREFPNLRGYGEPGGSRQRHGSLIVTARTAAILSQFREDRSAIMADTTDRGKDGSSGQSGLQLDRIDIGVAYAKWRHRTLFGIDHHFTRYSLLNPHSRQMSPAGVEITGTPVLQRHACRVRD